MQGESKTINLILHGAVYECSACDEWLFFNASTTLGEINEAINGHVSEAHPGVASALIGKGAA